MRTQDTDTVPCYKEVHSLELVSSVIEATSLVSDLNSRDIKEMLLNSGAVLDGHFVLLSGKHILRYLVLAKVLRQNYCRKILGLEIATRFSKYNFDGVLSPITFGGLLGSIIARELDKEIFYIDVDEETGEPVSCFVSGWGISSGHRIKRVLIVDALLTVSGLHTIAALLSEVGVEIAGIGLFTNLENGPEELASSIGDIDAEDIQFLVNLDREYFRCYDPPCPYPDCGNAPIVKVWEISTHRL